MALTLDYKQQLYKKLRAEDNLDEVTYENILKSIQKETAEALKKAKAAGMNIHDGTAKFPENVKAAVVNTDVLANLGHMCAFPFEDEYTKKMLYYIVNGAFFPVVVSTIFLEVVKAKLLGDDETYDFMIKYCYLLDNSNRLEDVARLTFQQMTKTEK